MELEKLQSTLASVNGNVHYYHENDAEIDKFIRFFPHLKSFEKPDMYSLLCDDILFIEHFEFDSTDNNRKGSQLKKEASRIETEVANIGFRNNKKLYHNQLHCSHSIENYINNAIQHFENHYSKIYEYKNHLTSSSIAKSRNKIKSCFFMEDVTALGNLCIKKQATFKDSPACLCIFFCKQFLDFLEDKKEVDYILSSGYAGNKYFLWLYTKESFQKFREQQIDISEYEIIDFSPQVSHVELIIPNSNNE